MRKFRLALALCLMSAGCAAQSAVVALVAKRAFYGRRLEPKASIVLHGAGQSDETSFAVYSKVLAPAKPMLSMSYVDLKDDIPAYFARLRAELARYPELIVPQIGLAMNQGEAARHYEGAVASGAMDGQLQQVCDGLRSLDRPVFLRPGYEFNGSWNEYEPVGYVAAFRRISQKVHAGCGLQNVALVWDWSVDAELDAEHGGSPLSEARGRWERFYPGDAWVDWWGVNLFSEEGIASAAAQAYLDEAARHRFPVMIAESTPKGHPVSEGSAVIDGWFAPYFGLIARSPQIKAFCYINWDWSIYPLWAQWGDARVQSNAAVLAFYRTQVGGPNYVGARDRSTTTRLLGAR